jgi:hypothetical protein
MHKHSATIVGSMFRDYLARYPAGGTQHIALGSNRAKALTIYQRSKNQIESY